MLRYLVVTPAQLPDASRLWRNFAHAAYRIGGNSTLLRQNLLLQTQGGLLAVSDRDAPPIAAPEQLCAAVLRECARRNYTGVLLDFELPATPDRTAFAARLGQLLAGGQRQLYVPERYGSAVPEAAVLISTALSGGSLKERLQEAREQAGSRTLALDVQRVRMDFRLPSPAGQGTPLTAGELEQLLHQEQPAVFFSPDLCARYFTFTRAEQTHFVLFDDRETLSRKLRLGEELGYAAAFLLYPEIQDLPPEGWK